MQRVQEIRCTLFSTSPQILISFSSVLTTVTYRMGEGSAGAIGKLAILLAKMLEVFCLQHGVT